jgi:hypothetical protein
MTSHSYNEDKLAKQPAIGLFAELGWTMLSKRISGEMAV